MGGWVGVERGAGGSFGRDSYRHWLAAASPALGGKTARAVVLLPACVHPLFRGYCMRHGVLGVVPPPPRTLRKSHLRPERRFSLAPPLLSNAASNACHASCSSVAACRALPGLGLLSRSMHSVAPPAAAAGPLPPLPSSPTRTRRRRRGRAAAAALLPAPFADALRRKSPNVASPLCRSSHRAASAFTAL